jgi:hypothetical protein
MAHDIPSKKESPVTARADQPKMPKYDYQPNDSRTFSVGYEAPEKVAADPHCQNSMSLKIFN